MSNNHYEAGGLGKNALVSGRIREGGRYAVRRDDKQPAISIVKEGWKRMQISVSDEGSGLARFRVRIDGKFVPFNMDNKGRYFGEPSNYDIQPNKTHQIEITAWDNCGNMATLTENKVF